MCKRSMAAAAAGLLLVATGCATSGDLNKLADRVQTLERQEGRIARLEKRVDDADQRASAAEAGAQRSASEAREAAQHADDASRRANAMFKKSVTK